MLKIKRSLFTLIELLIVIAIIVILAGMLMAAMKAVSKKKDAAATEAVIWKLHEGLVAYELKHGEYPPVAGGHTYSSSVLYDALINIDEPFCEVPDDFIKNGEIVDSWGNVIYYIPASMFPARCNGVPYWDAASSEIKTGFAELAIEEGAAGADTVFANRTTFLLRSMGANKYNDQGAGDDIQNMQR